MMKAVKTTRSVWLTLALAVLATGLVIVLGLHLDRATHEDVVTSFSQRQLLLGGSVIAVILVTALLVVQSGYKRVVAEEQVRHSESLHRRSEELAALREISPAISAQLELDELLQNIVEQGCRLLDVKAGGVYLVDETEGDLELVVSHGYARDYTSTRLAAGEGLSGRVLQSGEPLVVDDYRHWEGRSPGWEAEPLTAVLGVPLKIGDQVIGVLDFGEMSRARDFDERDLRLATLFANQAAIAIENARLYQAARTARESADTLREISRAVGSTLELDQVLSIVLRQAKRVLAYDTASILLFADGQPAMVAVAGYEDEEMVKSEVSLRLGDSPILQAMARDHLPIIIADVREDERWIWVPGAEDIRAWIGTPLLVRDEMVGALMIDSTQSGLYTTADGAIAQTLANQAAVAIENAHLYEQAQRRLESLTNLNLVSQAITSSLDVNEVLEQIVELAGSVVNSDYTSVVLLDEAGEPVLGTGDFRGIPPLARRMRSSGVTRHVLDSGQPLVVDTISGEGAMIPPLRWPDGELMEANPDIVAAGIRSFAAVPIQAKGKMLGVAFVHSRQPRAFHGQLSLLTTFVNQAAVALENARLYEAERKRAAQLAVVNQVARKAAAILDPDQLLQEIVAAIQQGFGYHNVILLQLDQAAGELGKQAISGGFEDIVTPDYCQKVGEGLIGWTAETGQSLLVNDVSQDSRYIVGFQEQASTVAELCVPLKLGDRVIGVLDVQEIRPNAFDEMDLTAMETLADQIAVAIENSRLYEAAQQEIAERKQAEELLQKANADLEALYHIGQMINSTLETGAILDRLTDEAMRVTRATHGQVLVVWKESGRFERRSLRGFSPPEAELARTVPLLLDRGVNGRAYTTCQTVRVDDVRDEPGYFPLIPATRTELAVPITREGEVMGNLDLQSPEVGAFRDADLDYLNALADQAAVAIENARLFEAEREQRQLTEALEEAAAAVSSTLDPDQVLDRILEQVERVVAGDTFNVMLVEGDQARVVRRLGRRPVGATAATTGYESLGAEEQSAAFSCPIARYPSLVEMMRTGEPVVMPDTMADPGWVQEENRGWLRSYVAAPIKVGDVTVGFLNVNGTRPGQFDATDARRLYAFADHVATAIENARLHGKLREHAEQLEQRVEKRTAQLQAQYAQSEAILQSATDGIAVTDVEGEIIRVNPVAQTWLTRTLSPGDASRLRETVRELARRAETQPEAVLELTGLDLEVKASPIAEPGIAAAAVVAIHDVSHLKALERMKSQFVSNVSHELRTPVTVIKLYAHLMQRQPEKWKEHLDTLAREADCQARLIEDILRISSIDVGRLEIKPQPTSLNELIEMAIANNQMLAQEQRLTLKPRLAEPGSVVLVDSRRMAQVLGNLVENAIRYTPQGGAVVVSTGQEEADGRTWATATVTDTGMGVPEDELPHIFERFFRGEEPSLMQISGTGLGLAIVKEVVELHGGRVAVESQLGKGSTFTIWLPLAD